MARSWYGGRAVQQSGSVGGKGGGGGGGVVVGQPECHSVEAILSRCGCFASWYMSSVGAVLGRHEVAVEILFYALGFVLVYCTLLFSCQCLQMTLQCLCQCTYSCDCFCTCPGTLLLKHLF